MPKILDPFRFVVIAVAGCMNQKQQHAIEYLREENRVLREQPGTRRLRFTDNQRRRVATKAKLVDRRVLGEITDLVTPDTLLGCTSRQTRSLDGNANGSEGSGRGCRSLVAVVEVVPVPPQNSAD
jgi:hypothetical protein